MPAIRDKQNGRRYGQVQFLNEVVDFITTAEGRRPCYDLLDGLQKRQAGREAAVSSIVLRDEPGVPQHLRGSSYELVDDESDAERSDTAWREGKYLKPQEAAAFLRVDARTVKRWAQQGKVPGFRTPGGHWRIDEVGLRRMQRSHPATAVGRQIVTAAAVAEVDLGRCLVCGNSILAGEEYVSIVGCSFDGTITNVVNRHAACHGEQSGHGV